MPYLGDAARVCDTYNQKFRAFSWPTANVTLDMIWIGHHDTCWNGLGISFSYWPGLRERIRLSLANAANILKLPYHTDIPISEDVLMNSSDAQRPAYIVINSGLHDIEAIYKDRAVNFTAYEERLDEIVQMAKNTSAHVIIAHTNPQGVFLYNACSVPKLSRTCYSRIRKRRCACTQRNSEHRRSKAQSSHIAHLRNAKVSLGLRRPCSRRGPKSC